MLIKLEITGIVQGVGFRPFAKREAVARGVDGYVLNKGSAVEIIARAGDKALKDYVQCLICHPPKGAFIADHQVTELRDDTLVPSPFEIKVSESTSVSPLFVSPDIATCPDCEREYYDPSNPRYKHPFISCAVCGPRYSVIRSMPYDRDTTVMDQFPMCKDCTTEYNTLSDRRCFAQTIACHHCGPELSYWAGCESDTPLESAISALKSEKVIAVKDIGGFHFACLANSEKAVETLRNLKRREQKPFAVMFRNREQLLEYCDPTELELEALESPAKPIVLLPKKKEFTSSACTGSRYVGALLPCNPVQFALLDQCSPLIMTSGNLTEEPIITDENVMVKMCANSEHLEGVLYHNRKILTPLDDSIVRVLGGKVQVTRRARGFVPLPIKLGCGHTQIFAAGGDLKSTFCYLKDGYAYVSQHLGDLENENTARVYHKTVDRLGTLLEANPEKYVCDMHPGYVSTHLHETDLKVQHHHAHVLSVMAEHRLTSDVLGFAFDGTGYGTDGTVWGCEVLLCKDTDYQRLRTLKPVKMCGGNLVSKDASRVLECYRASAGKCTDTLLLSALENNINTALYSSMGRLFDATSALLGVCKYNSYEGECASKLEAVATKGTKVLPLEFDFDGAKILSEMEILLQEGNAVEDIALSFHEAIAKAILKTATEVGTEQVALTGGVFGNRLLSEKALKLLTKSGFKVYMNEKVPCNDGGISLGQAYYAAKRG